MNLDPETIDDMHHALGRPTDERKEPYRNRYVCGAASPTAERFRASGAWDFVCTINGGNDAIYEVNEEGVAFVLDQVRETRLATVRAEEAQGIRNYRVSIKHDDHVSTQRAKSGSEAKYLLYLHLADAGWAQDGFFHYLRTYQPTARLA